MDLELYLLDALSTLEGEETYERRSDDRDRDNRYRDRYRSRYRHQYRHRSRYRCDTARGKIVMVVYLCLPVPVPVRTFVHRICT